MMVRIKYLQRIRARILHAERALHCGPFARFRSESSDDRPPSLYHALPFDDFLRRLRKREGRWPLGDGLRDFLWKEGNSNFDFVSRGTPSLRFLPGSQ